MSNMKKKIIVKSEVFTNYIGHLFGVAKIGFESEYSNRYLHTICENDIKYLSEKSDLLAWSDGPFGELTNIFVFFPAYLNLSSKPEIISYLQILLEAIQERTFEHFIEKYHAPLNRLHDWFEPEFPSELFSCKYEIKRISEIFIRNFDRFTIDVLPVENEKIMKKARLLNSELSKYDFITLWEELFQLEFKYPQYEIILGCGMKNGPTANSLGYEKNWFSYEGPMDWFVPFISHEVGTHILIDLLKNILKDEKVDSGSGGLSIFYQGYENLCRFYNTMILSRAGIEGTYSLPDYNTDTFFGIYKKIYDTNPKITPEELYRKGIEEYQHERE